MTQADLLRDLARPVVLVGLMGVGKTTVGRRLAARLNRPFVDADEEIERSAGRPIPEIFADFGEDAFRDGERRVIARILESPRPMVLALGGGAFVQAPVRELVKATAVSIWLRADLDTLMERVGRRPGARPLLETEDPREVMARLIDVRAPAYGEADIIVDSASGSHDATTQRVVEALMGWMETAGS
jgi:shikimate kinase